MQYIWERLGGSKLIQMLVVLFIEQSRMWNITCRRRVAAGNNNPVSKERYIVELFDKFTETSHCVSTTVTLKVKGEGP